MGNCLDVPPQPQAKRRYHYPSAFPRRSETTFRGSNHSLVTVDAYLPYHLPGPRVPAYGPSVLSAPSYYHPPHPSFYHPMHAPYSDNAWYSGFESFEEYRHQKKQKKDNRTGDAETMYRDRKLKRSNLNSVIITTKLDPKDDVIKRGPHILLANGLIQSGILPEKTSFLTEKKQTAAKDKFDTAPIRGSTYITYIEDDPSPLKTEENIKKVETESVESGFRDTPEGDDGIVRLFVDEHVASSSISGKSTNRSLDDILYNYGAPTSQLKCQDVVVCFGSHESVAMKMKKSLEAAGVSVWMCKCSLSNSSAESNTSAHAVIEAKVLVVLLSLDSIKLPLLRDYVSLAHVSDTSVFPVSLDHSLDIITSMDISLKLQLGVYKWTELLSDAYFELTMSRIVHSVRDEVNMIHGFEIIDEDYGRVSSKSTRRQKTIRQQLLTRSVDLATHITAAIYWETHYKHEDEIGWGRFLSDIHTNFHELLTCSVPKASFIHFNEALKLELVDHPAAMVHKSTFVEFCKDLGTDRDVWEKLHTVARETQAMLNIFDSGSLVRAAVLNKFGKVLSPYMVNIVRDLIKNRNATVRAVAAVVLSQYTLPDDHVTMAAILATLDDGQSVVREAGCRAVIHLSAKRAKDKLKLLSQTDTSPQVREAAVRAIKELEKNS